MVKYMATQKVYFISGIDTGIGKTIATGLMARALAARGVDVITVKLVQTGNDGFSEDLARTLLNAGRSARYRRTWRMRSWHP